MAALKSLFIFVLLTQLVNFSIGNIEGDFDKNLSNASTILIQDKFNESLIHVLDNATSVNNFDNVSLPLEATSSLLGLIEEEKEIEVELKNVLEEAASSGQLIMLSDSQAENSNLSNIIAGPLIMIENLSAATRSPIPQSGTIDDQDIAQSQIRTRTRPRNHEEHEDIENIEDILAIAEYEPQKLDVQKNEITETETSIVESTSHRLPEEMHYDVPRRKNFSATPERPIGQVRWSKTPKIYLNDSRAQLTTTESSQDTTRHQKDRAAPRHRLSEYDYKAEKKKSLSPLSIRKKLSSLEEKWLREPRHLKLLSSNRDPLTFVVPRIPAEDLKYPKANGSYSENITNFSAPARREFRPSTRTTFPATVPLTYPTIEPNQFSTDPQSKYHEPQAVALKHPRLVNRRNDYLDYGTTEIHSAPNDRQLASSNHYNSASRTTKRLPNPYPHPPIPIPTNQPNIPAENTEEEAIESGSPEKNAEYDYYEESEEESSQRKPYLVDYPDKRPSDAKTIPTYDSYDESIEQRPPSQRTSYPVDYPEKETSNAKTIPTYDSYDESDEQRSPSQRTSRPVNFPDKGTSSVKIIPTYDSYDESNEQRRPSQREPYSVDYPEKEKFNAKFIPAYRSFEDATDPKLYKLYQNGVNPPSKSAETDYVNYESDEMTTTKPKLRSSSSAFRPAAKKLQGAAANRFVGISTKPINYGQLVSTIGPVAQSDSVTGPIYPYENIYSNPKPTVPDNGHIEKRPVGVTKHPQIVYPPNKTYELEEASEERASKSFEDIRQPVRKQNDVEEGYVNLENGKNKRLTKVGKPSRVYDKGSGNDYRSQSENTLASPPSLRATQFNPQSTLTVPLEHSSLVHTKSPRIINEYITDDYKLHSPTSSVQLQKDDSQGRKNNPVYDFYDAYKSINVSPATARPTLLNHENSAHYGTRVKPLKVLEQQNPLPSSPQTYQTRPIDSSIDRRQQPIILPVRNHVEPAESVQRSNSLRDAQDYEDEVPASSGHEENHETHAESRKDEVGDEESEKGGGEKHEEAHHNSSGEKAEKDYKEWHEYDKGKKGHHDKEHHDNEYREEKGGKKKHEEESGYHKEHHHGEKGSKESEFAEKGKHEKGHSTKGEHVVHKKDEYEKKTEFYDESHEEDGDEKEGEYHHEHEDKKGGHEKIGHHDSAYHMDKYGEKGEHEKGQHWHETKGHEKKDGREQDHSHEEKYGKKGGHEEGEKWSHNNGDKGQR